MKQKKRRYHILLTTIALVSIPLAIGYTNYAISIQNEPEQSEAQIAVPRVSVIQLNSAAHQGVVTSYAEVRASDEISLSSLVSGRVTWRSQRFTNGQQVIKGDALLRLDDTEYREALAIAHQNLAEANLDLQKEKQQQRQAKTDWQRSGLSERPSALALRKPQLKLAQARYKAAKSSLIHARRNFAETTIKAPFSGVVINRNAALGSYVEAGNTLSTLRGSAEAEMVLTLSASQWQQLPQDLSATVVQLHNPDQPESHWEGRISPLSAAIDPSTRQRSLTIHVKNPLAQQPPLLSGSFISARIKGHSIDNLFEIPSTSLTADGYIWSITNDRLQRHKSQPLFSANGKLYIPQKQLPEQIALVVKPLASYLPDMEVEPYTTGPVAKSLAYANGAN
ncbi:efflux RND transporter periplasmic adaptor subunit [Neptunomonas japonica]|uniref:efflux RND transporter periplasmic adaptor subunit n=1 Tax=Neptunomonas japonica TaxID=417574 RepID=UPI00041F5F4F|nr:efflux RND transporter periplasmic adaptor subunit [Neptunomonas japonica]